MFHNIRGGILRTGATLSITVAGFVLLTAMLGLLYARAKNQVGLLKLGVLTLVGAVALYCTGSRGAWATAILGLGAYALLTRFGKAARIAGIAVGVVGVLFLSNLSRLEEIASGDEFGTFQYRVELLRISIAEIGNHPFFGSKTYLNSPAMQQLIQGQGIIDLVNSYVQVALEYGLIGLAIFTGMFAAVASKLLSASLGFSARIAAGREQDIRNINAALLSMIGAYLFMIFTVSMISYTFLYGVVILAAARAFMPVLEQYASERKAQAAPANDDAATA